MPCTWIGIALINECHKQILVKSRMGALDNYKEQFFSTWEELMTCSKSLEESWEHKDILSDFMPDTNDKMSISGCMFLYNGGLIS